MAIPVILYYLSTTNLRLYGLKGDIANAITGDRDNILDIWLTSAKAGFV